MGGQGGSTQGAGAANGVGLPQDQSVGMGLRAQEIGIEMANTLSQIKLNESQARKNEAEANKIKGVMKLSDVYSGNRKTRKKIMRDVLGDAPGWIQTIKCADLISNATSIIKHDPEFAKVFCAEAVALLDVMDKADSRLRDMAYSVVCKNEKNENREMSKMLEE